MTRVLLTGAGGFAGHHALEHILDQTDWDVVATDSFRHKGKTDRIGEVLDNGPYHRTSVGWRSRVNVLTHDLSVPFSEQAIGRMRPIDYMVCYASESHVDRSITDPVPFTQNNVNVALSTLELARALKPKQVIWISTDEVYGPVAAEDRTGHPEWAPILPSNPYAASKAAQEAIAISYWRTYGVPLVLVNCMNMIGERQDPEKFVPLVVSKVLKGETVKIHADTGQDYKDIGTRHYLHARNLADGVLFLLRDEIPAIFHGSNFPHWAEAHFTADMPDRYNIAAPDRIDNLTMAKMIAGFLGKDLKFEFENFHSTRPGHDPHYGLDGLKMHRLGWTPPVPFEESLRRTVEWTKLHTEWLV